MANGNVMRQGFIGSTVDDMYFASVTGTQNGGFLECYKDYARRTQFVISPPTDNTPLHAWISQTADGAHWTSKILATCETPEVHELPLASDCIATEVCYYYRTQENICHVKFAVTHSSGTIPPGNFLVATLPEGFRPKENIWRPAFGLTNRTLADAFANAHICTDGKIIIDGASVTIQSAWFDFYFVVQS